MAGPFAQTLSVETGAEPIRTLVDILHGYAIDLHGLTQQGRVRSHASEKVGNIVKDAQGRCEKLLEQRELPPNSKLFHVCFLLKRIASMLPDCDGTKLLWITKELDMLDFLRDCEQMRAQNLAMEAPAGAIGFVRDLLESFHATDTNRKRSSQGTSDARVSAVIDQLKPDFFEELLVVTQS